MTLTNDQMTPRRFEKWATYRNLFARITTCLNAGGRVVVGTMTKATVYSPKHVGMFTCDKKGVYVQTGRQRVLITGCSIRFGRLAKEGK